MVVLEELWVVEGPADAAAQSPVGFFGAAVLLPFDFLLAFPLLFVLQEHLRVVFAMSKWGIFSRTVDCMWV